MNRRKSVVCSGSCRPDTSTKCRFLSSLRAAKTDGFGRLGLLPDLSSDLLVAEAASRGVRYDKYFAIGNFSHYTFSPGDCQCCAPGIIRHQPQFFSCIFPRNGVLVFRNKFAETITCRAILSGGCELSHGFAVIDLSLEQPERAQGFLRSCLYRNRPSNLLVLVDTPTAVLFCRPNPCGPDIGLPGRRERGVNHHPFSHQHSMPAQTLYSWNS